VLAWFHPGSPSARFEVQHESLCELKVPSFWTNRLFPRHPLSTLQMGSSAHPFRGRG